MRDINSMSRGNALAQRGATHYLAQLGPQDKGRAIKGLVVCWSMARINDICDGSMDQRKVRG